MNAVNWKIPFTAIHTPTLPQGMDMLVSPQILIEDGILLRYEVTVDTGGQAVRHLNFMGEHHNISPTYVCKMAENNLFYTEAKFGRSLFAYTVNVHATIPHSLDHVGRQRAGNTWVPYVSQ